MVVVLPKPIELSCSKANSGLTSSPEMKWRLTCCFVSLTKQTATKKRSVRALSLSLSLALSLSFSPSLYKNIERVREYAANAMPPHKSTSQKLRTESSLQHSTSSCPFPSMLEKELELLVGFIFEEPGTPPNGRRVAMESQEPTFQKPVEIDALSRVRESGLHEGRAGAMLGVRYLR